MRPQTFLSLILLMLSACSLAIVPAAPVEVQDTPSEASATPTVETEMTEAAATSAPQEAVYPYYVSLATKPEIEPQTIDGVTTQIDWVYLDESRVAIHYTTSGLNWPDGPVLEPGQQVRIAIPVLSDFQFGGFSGASSGSASPVEDGVLTGSSDQALLDGALDAGKYPTVELQVDIPVEGPTNAGTFHFQFSAPVLDGFKLENINQTVVANDVAMTLKTLSLTPSYAQALICFQMPSAVDWGLTASSVTLGDREYPFSGGGLLPGTDGKGFALTDPERCSTTGFDIAYDGSVSPLTLTVPRLVASVPEVIDGERVDTANQRLADRGIEFEYENLDHGGNIVILKRPAGATDMEVYPLIWEALAEQHEGPWVFTVPIER